MRLPSLLPLKSENGAVVVEFALLSIFLIVLLFGIIEFGFLWMQSHYINNAAREAARAASKLNADEDPTAIVEKAVRDMLKGVYDDALVDNPASCCDSDSFIVIGIDETTVTSGDLDLRSFEVVVDVRTADIWQPVLWGLLNLIPGVELEDIEHIRGTALFIRQDQSLPDS